jgi:peptidyl-prolyl cis-trans isomerase C
LEQESNMPICVNDVELTDAEVQAELALNPDVPNALHQAVTTRVLHHLVMQEAQRLGIEAQDEEEAVAQVLALKAPAPEPDAAACQRFYDAHPERFAVGACVEADHILFQVTPQLDLNALRLLAEEVLEQVLATPAEFETLAAKYSNCPSAQVGGNLGQLSRGDTVPEFDKAVFAAAAGQVIPKLVHTRHGLHIVRVRRKVAGRPLPFDEVADEVAQVMQAMALDQAWRQYAKVLVSNARITGIDLDAGVQEDRLMVGHA